MQDKTFQYFEFTRREVHRSSGSHGTILSKIEFNIPELVPLKGSYSVRCSPQMRPNPSQELPDAEWLRDIIIGTDFQPYNLIGLLAARCQHDNWSRDAFGSLIAAHLQSTQFGEHYIKTE